MGIVEHIDDATAVVLAPPSGSADGVAERTRRLLEQSFLPGVTANTRRAYARDLDDFAAWLCAPDAAAGASRLLTANAGGANDLVLRWKIALEASGAAPATVARKLAAVRSLVSAARLTGMVGWEIEVRSPRVRSYRDTAGPGVDGVRRLLAAARGNGPKARRDRAILHLLFDLALRRGEVVTLDMEHLDLEGGCIWIKGKGRAEREKLTLPASTRHALEDWLTARGGAPGPLFLNVDRARKGSGRLTPQSVYRIVRSLGRKAGLADVRPHGLRHAAITEALEHHDLRTVARYSRHRNIQTLVIYDDNRQDLGGVVAADVAASVVSI
jgi:integrase/recombinase XerC